jgi:hypothetical protein
MLGSAWKNRFPSWRGMRIPGQQREGGQGSHAAGLYRQALLTLGDASLAEQVVMTVIVDDCIRSGAANADARAAARRLAISTYWRCQDLAGNRGQQGRPGAPPEPGDTDCAALSVRERGIIGLVVFGGLGYAQASLELAIPAGDLAAIVRAALRPLADPAASHAPLRARDATGVPPPAARSRPLLVGRWVEPGRSIRSRPRRTASGLPSSADAR